MPRYHFIQNFQLLTQDSGDSLFKCTFISSRPISKARGLTVDGSHSPRTIVLEGERLITDAVLSGGRIRSLYFSSRSNLGSLNLSECSENVYYVPLKVLKQFSGVKTCPGLLAVFEVPRFVHDCKDSSNKNLWKPLPVVLILDNIRDPGNMGTLIRTASGFGLLAVLASKGCVDIWNEKVVRAGMSAHFRIPIYSGLPWKEIDQFIHYEFKSNASSSASKPKVFVADIATYSDAVDTHPAKEVMAPVADSDYSEAAQPPASLHTSINYFSPLNSTTKHDPSSPVLALVIGSEAHGPSPEAFLLCSRSRGCRLVIPCAPKTDSLCAPVAAAVILGEMQRQYLTQQND